MTPSEPTPSSTKTCPFCKELVHADAIKCRYCQSMLLPVQPDANTTESSPAGKVTYILDQGLVSFGKFAGAVLGVFIVVGAYLYGFKLDNALGKVQEQQGELTKLLEAVRTSKARVDSAEQQLQLSMQKVQTLEESFEDSLERKQSRATAFYAIQQLTFNQKSVLADVQAQKPNEFRRGTRFWPIGATLFIRFLEGDTQKQNKVKQIISKWFPYVNLNFQFVEKGNAQIRIGFAAGNGNWSYIGTDALAIPNSQPTMNYESIADEQEVLRRFGHVLGLINEINSPYASIPWNKEAAYKYFQATQGWTRATFDNQLFAKVPKDKLGTYRPFDPNSIMMYDIPAEVTYGEIKSVRNGLSPSDKALVARIYPRK